MRPVAEFVAHFDRGHSVRLGTLLALAVAITCTDVGVARAADDTALRLSNVSAANTAYVRVANDAAFSLQAFTLEAWIQRVGPGYGGTGDALGAAIIAKPTEGLTGSFLGSWHLNWTNSGALVFTVVHTHASSGVFLTAPVVATPLARHHVAATFDGDTLRAFVDGELSAQANWDLGSVYYGSEDVLIGGQNFGAGFLRRFDGFIDDVRVWDHALAEAESAGRMNCHLSGSEPGLVSYWTFGASDLSDASGNGHGGAVGGLAGSLTYASLASLGDCAVGVVRQLASSPTGPSMFVFPQPTRGPITVALNLPRDGWASLDVFDVAGRRRGVLASQDYGAGRREIALDIRTLGTTELNPGVFFLRLRSEGQTVVRRLVLIR
jgi:hypothetical protein